MKKSIVFLFAGLYGLILTAQEEGLNFFDGPWSEALNEARALDKPIFLDAYASWCGPCRMMHRDVFPEKAVGDFYNDHFVNVHVDMEEGEGIALAEKYAVGVFPTLLFLDAEGTILHRAVGYHSIPKFLELGRVALDPSRRYSNYQRRYADGERDPDFLREYALAAFDAMDEKTQAIAEQYLATQSDWGTQKNQEFIFNLVDDTDSPLFDYLTRNRAEFEEVFGSQVVVNRIQNLILGKAFSPGASSQEALKNIEALYEKAYPEAAEQLTAIFRMNYFQYTGDIPNFSQATAEYLRRFPPGDAAEWNNAAWAFYENVDDPKMLREALSWARRSVAMDEQYYNFDTLAALLHKLGQKKKALKAANRAIELAIESGQDYSETELLLREIKGKKR
jgi:thioredoxin-related protein